MNEVWFWQGIFSPHMMGLATALVDRGCKVTYVAEQAMSADRAKQGWAIPEFGGVSCALAESGKTVETLVQSAPVDSIHICQGIRGNGLVARAQQALFVRALRQWVVMETVYDAGWAGVLKRFEYSRLFRARRKRLDGVLATGHRTADWIVARGMPADRVYPFAYFLPEPRIPVGSLSRDPVCFRFLFVGRFIPLKRVDWLIEALAMLTDRAFEVWLVGAGEDEAALRALAAAKLGVRARWLGSRPLTEIPSVMSQVDCLVLPSMRDGWGAVVSEALMTGTPVVCSEACGSAGVVRASGFGSVFSGSSIGELCNVLRDHLRRGPIDPEVRSAIASWATCLGAHRGADYLIKILDRLEATGPRPVPPWLGNR